MVVYDERNKMYVDIRREATGYGATPDEARRQADQAERVIRKRAEESAKRRRGALRRRRRVDRVTG